MSSSRLYENQILKLFWVWFIRRDKILSESVDEKSDQKIDFLRERKYDRGEEEKEIEVFIIVT